MSSCKTDCSGQSLIELVVSMAIALLVLGALTFSVITSLRNAQFAKNQVQATKLAQEALEKIRSLRDRDGSVDYVKPDLTHTTKFSELWDIALSCPGNCYFVFDQSGVLTGTTATTFESISPNLKRQVQIEDESDKSLQKKVTALVQWNDASGTHQSILTTILRNITR